MNYFKISLTPWVLGTVSTGSGLLPVQHQAITRTNAECHGGIKCTPVLCHCITSRTNWCILSFCNDCKHMIILIPLIWLSFAIGIRCKFVVMIFLHCIKICHLVLYMQNCLRNVNLRLVLFIDGWGISCEITPRWMSLDLNEDKSTLVQVMAWCRQATSHYLSQCWPRSLQPYGITRPQWVNTLSVFL